MLKTLRFFHELPTALKTESRLLACLQGLQQLTAAQPSEITFGLLEHGRSPSLSALLHTLLSGQKPLSSINLYGTISYSLGSASMSLWDLFLSP